MPIKTIMEFISNNNTNNIRLFFDNRWIIPLGGYEDSNEIEVGFTDYGHWLEHNRASSDELENCEDFESHFELQIVTMNRFEAIEYTTRLLENYIRERNEQSHEFFNEIGLQNEPCSQSFYIDYCLNTQETLYYLLHDLENNLDKDNSYEVRKVNNFIEMKNGHVLKYVTYDYICFPKEWTDVYESLLYRTDCYEDECGDKETEEFLGIWQTDEDNNIVGGVYIARYDTVDYLIFDDGENTVKKIITLDRKLALTDEINKMRVAGKIYNKLAEGGSEI